MTPAGRFANGAQLRALVVLAALAACGFLALHVYLRGSLVIRDADGVVEAVALRNSEHQVLASRVIGGLYVTTARLEGEAVVRCRNGRQINYGYYTNATHIWRTVRASDCFAAPTP